jgi:hypothetical protein
MEYSNLQKQVEQFRNEAFKELQPNTPLDLDKIGSMLIDF